MRIRQSQVRESENTRPQRGFISWLWLGASAGLLYFAWRFAGEARALREETESDVRTLRDEYARLERERAALHTQLEAVGARLAAIEAAPAVAPPAPVEPPVLSPAVPEAALPIEQPGEVVPHAALNGTAPQSFPTAVTPRSPRRRPTPAAAPTNNNGEVAVKKPSRSRRKKTELDGTTENLS